MIDDDDNLFVGYVFFSFFLTGSRTVQRPGKTKAASGSLRRIPQLRDSTARTSQPGEIKKTFFVCARTRACVLTHVVCKS